MSDVEQVVIVGSGFAGLCAAIKLKEAGIDFTILEKAQSLGGTWRDNHYPGCAVDVESHLYSFSFEQNPRFTRQFAPQWQILEYMEHCARKYGLMPHFRFDTTVVRATFQEATGLWDVETHDGKRLRARYLVSGTGGLSRPALPDIPGLSSFQGDAFHSSRWRDDVPLEGKDVAIIGTGASSIQIVPEIAQQVRRLYVHQRTAPWIIPRPDRAIGQTERKLLERFPALLSARRLGLFAKRELFWLGFLPSSPIGKAGQLMARRHLEKSVPDPGLRARLTPSYHMGCKRILLSNDYYPALARPNVELVTDGIESVVPDGVKTRDGKVRKLDALVLATGFYAAESVAPFEVRGRAGKDLAATWEQGAEAYLGTTVSGFPNFFMIVGPNTGLGHGSMIFMIESQVAYLVSAIQTMRKERAAFADVLPDVQRRYNEDMHERLSRRVWATGGCVSWYRTKSGKNTTLYPGLMSDFNLRLRKFDPESYELLSASKSAAASEVASPADA